MLLTAADLRRHAIASTLFPETTLGKAMAKLGFVQADPIRSPAPAQDLILRQRVVDYRAGDLHRHYRRLKLEEDYLYAYGFMPKATWKLIHPRPARPLEDAEVRVLELIPRRGHLHPRELESHLGKSRERNAWGGYSKATTRTLERLHYMGLLRIAGRSGGVKLYQAAPAMHEPFDDTHRLQGLALRIARILAPLPESSLRAALQHLRYSAPGLTGRKSAVAELLKSGALESAEVDGMRYVWPADLPQRPVPPARVRFLAPFDPLVWDRRRFEHLWKWAYRFEAYTPPARRKLGYYALPLLWREDVIGWVNVSRSGDGLQTAPGYVSGSAPRERGFRDGFDEEIAKLQKFLPPGDGLLES